MLVPSIRLSSDGLTDLNVLAAGMIRGGTSQNGSFLYAKNAELKPV
jgi:hypothetical protein